MNAAVSNPIPHPVAYAPLAFSLWIFVFALSEVVRWLKISTGFVTQSLQTAARLGEIRGGLVIRF